MATSGSTNYSVDRDTLIKESLQLIGAIGEGIEPTSAQVSDASRSLNIMVKAWQAYGLHLWTIEDKAVDLVANISYYTFGPSGDGDITETPVNIVQVLYRDSTDTDTEMIGISRQEYKALSTKDTTGDPSQYYYDYKNTNSKLYIYPAPSTTAASGTLRVVYESPIEDLDSGTDDFDMPQYWYEAVKYGLAHRLAPVYGLGYMERVMLKKDFEEILDLALSNDAEKESIFFGIERG